MVAEETINVIDFERKHFVYMKFCKIFAAISASIFVIILAINYIMDPYDVWHNVRYVGFNMYAIRSENMERFFKPINILNRYPETIFLGNSKCDFALDPEHYTEITGVTDAYNMAIRNGQPYELRRYVEMEIDKNPRLKTVVLAVDYEMFVDSRVYMPGFDEEQAKSGRMTESNLIKSLLSYDASVDSLITVVKNNEYRYDFPTYEKNGKISEGALFTIFSDEASFYKNTRSFVVAQYAQKKEKNSDIYKEKFNDIEKIIRLCKEHGVDIKVIVPPVHAVHLDAYDIYWHEYELWCKRLAGETSFVSFNQYNAITASDPGENTDGNLYFWDSVHAKENVGNLVLEYLFGNSSTELPVNFAVNVDMNNVDNYLVELKKQHQIWALSNEDLKDKLKFVGRFVIDYPPELIGRKDTLNTNFVRLACVSDETQLSRNQIFNFEGQVKLSPTKVQCLYAIIEDDSGRRFFAMSNKKWRNDNRELPLNGFEKQSSETYDFLTGAITDNIPDGTYYLRMACVVKDEDVTYISPRLQKVVISG